MGGYVKHAIERRTSLIVLFLVIIGFVGSIFVVFSHQNNVAYAQQNSSYCLIDATSFRVLEGDNIHTRLPMASTTKAMTALIATESGKLDDIVEIPPEAVGVEGSSIYLKLGEKMSLRDLTYGLMLRSGNDAATAIALYLGGSIDGFADMMNERASKLNLKNTHFTNPHGLHDDNHYTSAYDLAVIAATALKNDECAKIVGSKSYRAESGENVRVFNNKNKLLWNYEGATGFKTGYTKKAGRCLIASSSREGQDVVAVVLNVPQMFEKCASLMDYAHENYVKKSICQQNDVVAEVPVVKGCVSSVGAKAVDDVAISIKEGEKLDCRYVLPDYIDQSLKKGEIIGRIEVFVDEQLQFSCDLVTIDEVVILEKN